MTMGVDWVIGLIGAGLDAAGVSPVLHSLVVDGILSGIGSVIGFLPTIVTLFFFLSILEDTGMTIASVPRNAKPRAPIP